MKVEEIDKVEERSAMDGGQRYLTTPAPSRQQASPRCSYNRAIFLSQSMDTKIQRLRELTRYSEAIPGPFITSNHIIAEVIWHNLICSMTFSEYCPMGGPFLKANHLTELNLR